MSQSPAGAVLAHYPTANLTIGSAPSLWLPPRHAQTSIVPTVNAA